MFASLLYYFLLSPPNRLNCFLICSSSILFVVCYCYLRTRHTAPPLLSLSRSLCLSRSFSLFLSVSLSLSYYYFHHQSGEKSTCLCHGEWRRRFQSKTPTFTSVTSIQCYFITRIVILFLFYPVLSEMWHPILPVFQYNGKSTEFSQVNRFSLCNSIVFHQIQPAAVTKE